MSDDVHMMIAMPPKYVVSQLIEFINGMGTIHLARVYEERKRNFVERYIWAAFQFVRSLSFNWAASC